MQLTKYLLCACLYSLPFLVLAQKPVPVQDFEFGGTIGQEEPSFIRLNERISETTGFPIAIYNPDFPLNPAEPETMAREYLMANRSRLGLSVQDLDDLQLHAVRESAAGTTVRLRQHYKGLPVNKAELTISITPANRVGFLMNSFAYGVAVANVNPTITPAAARAAAVDHIGLEGTANYEENELKIMAQNGRSNLIYRLLFEADAPQGQWEVFVNAHNGELLKVENIGCYYHDHHTAIQPTLPPPAPTFMINGTGNVFDPDPLSTAGAAYTNTGFGDNNDANSSQLIAEQVSVTLLDITFNGSVYQLIGPYAEIQDFESPNRGLFNQATPNWNFNRSDNAFEAANVYYHIDASMRYLNETIGVNVMPTNYNTGVRFDPSGLNNADNSHYLGGSQRVSFGDGGVDDAEDSDVIHHELGHGLHDWITNGGLSQGQGLSEGSGDYWAVSYNRSLNLWASNEAPYNWVFNWDGHNNFWSGRVTNLSGTYPGALFGGIHSQGQFWATSMMKVWDAIGKAKTDVIFWEGLGLTNGASNQNDAANAAYQAANNLGYSNADRLQIHTILTAQGYTLPGFVLPVEWLSFTGRAVQETVALNWSTADETNNEYFTVERSADGRSFFPIGRVRPGNNASNDYDFIDANPLKGSNIYRIRQTDFDGSYDFSNVITVTFTTGANWTMAPNPAKDQLQVQLGEVSTEQATFIQILDLSGRIVVPQLSVATGQTVVQVPIDNLPLGMYLLEVTDGVSRSVQRFSKQ